MGIKAVIFFLSFLKKYLFIYLLVPGISCGRWAP